MDVLLDILDTWVLDRFYATIFPRSPAKFIDYSSPSNNTEWANLNQNLNRYVEVTPSKWAVQSSWPRDNILRQGLSLFLVAW